MANKYSEEILNLDLCFDMFDGLETLEKKYSITEESLRDVFHVLPNDNVETAKKKIVGIISQDDFLYDFFNKDKKYWELKAYDPSDWDVSIKVPRALPKSKIYELGYNDDDIKRMKLPLMETSVEKSSNRRLAVKFAKRKPINALSDEAIQALFDIEPENYAVGRSLFTEVLLAAKAEEIVRKKHSKEIYDPEKLMVIPDVELHLGKLGSEFDSCDSYDYKKALYRYIRIMQKAGREQDEKFKAQTICMTIGNDFFNTDTEQNTTSAGTEQDNDTRFQQMFSSGIEAHTWAIESMKERCDKLVLMFNPGNHDFVIDFTLFMLLVYKYQNDPKVDVKCNVKDCKWATRLLWENNLLIFAHGKTPQGKAQNDDHLALLKDRDFKEDAKKVDNVTVMAGHLHQASENNYSKRRPMANGVTILRNGSPSGDGAWEAGNMYASDKSHQMYIFDAETGLDTTKNIKLTKEELKKGLVMERVSGDTNYLDAVGKSIRTTAAEIELEDAKKASAKNKKQIKEILKKESKLVKKILSIAKDPELTEEQKNALLLHAVGYDEEVEPYEKMQEMLDARVKESEHNLALARK